MRWVVSLSHRVERATPPRARRTRRGRRRTRRGRRRTRGSFGRPAAAPSPPPEHYFPVVSRPISPESNPCLVHCRGAVEVVSSVSPHDWDGYMGSALRQPCRPRRRGGHRQHDRRALRDHQYALSRAHRKSTCTDSKCVSYKLPWRLAMVLSRGDHRGRGRAGSVLSHMHHREHRIACCSMYHTNKGNILLVCERM